MYVTVVQTVSSFYHTNSLTRTQAVKEVYKHEGAFKVDDFAVMIDRHTSKICLVVLPDSSWKVTPRVNPPEVCKGPKTHTDDWLHPTCTFTYTYIHVHVVVKTLLVRKTHSSRIFNMH